MEEEFFLTYEEKREIEEVLSKSLQYSNSFNNVIKNLSFLNNFYKNKYKFDYEKNKFILLKNNYSKRGFFEQRKKLASDLKRIINYYSSSSIDNNLCYRKGVKVLNLEGLINEKYKIIYSGEEYEFLKIELTEINLIFLREDILLCLTDLLENFINENKFVKSVFKKINISKLEKLLNKIKKNKLGG